MARNFGATNGNWKGGQHTYGDKGWMTTALNARERAGLLGDRLKSKGGAGMTPEEFTIAARELERRGLGHLLEAGQILSPGCK